MPTTTPQRRGSGLWLVVAILAFLALALGMWDLIVERDGEANWLGQAVLPLVLLVFALAMLPAPQGKRGRQLTGSRPGRVRLHASHRSIWAHARGV